MALARVRAGLVGLAFVLSASAAFAQDTPTLTGSANGLTVSLNWTAVPGATGYDVIASLNGSPLGSIPVGNVTSLTVPVPAGVYSVSVRGTAGAVTGPASNAITLTAALTPPSPPTELTGAVSGNSILLSWNLDPTGVTTVAVQAGSSSGAADYGTFPLPVSKVLALPALGNGNYFVRVLAAGPGGISAPSNEAQLAVPGCVAPATIPFTVTSSGSFVKASWAAIPGATGYRLDVSSTAGGAPDVVSMPFSAATTSFSTFGAPFSTFYLTLHTTMACGPSVSSTEVALAVTAPVRPAPISEAAAQAMVAEATRAIAAQYPGDLRNSDVKTGGNNNFMFRVLQRLRQQNNRFGLNWKRGGIGDLSQDVISYIFDDAPEELADQHHLWMWDIITGHGGPNPSPNSQPIWNFRIAERWTIEPYLNRGFTP